MQMTKENVKREDFETLRSDELLTIQGGNNRPESEDIFARFRQFVLDLFQAD